jgi:hypothetical protein
MFKQQMSQSIEAGAPDITYSGNEGPKSPQQEQQMMEQQMMEQEQQMMSPVDYSSPAFKTELIEKLMEIEGLDLGAATAKAEWIIRNKLKPRKGAAFGGIMGLDGRRKYGWGSKIKDRIRKIIPNEVAKVAEVAAPFVAPFNPLAAGLMSGIGGFDRTGRIGSSIKSGLMNYGMGQAGRYLGGADFQTGINPMTGSGVQGAGFFSKPTGSGGIKNLFNKSQVPTDMSKFNELGLGGSNPSGIAGAQQAAQAGDASLYESIMGKNIADPTVAQNLIKGNQANNLTLLDKFKDFGGTALNYAKDHPYQAIMAASAIGGLMSMNQDDVVDEIMDRGEGLDIAGIRAEVTEAFKDSTGEKLLALRSKYPYLGTQASKNTAIMAYGGRIRRAEGGIMDLGGMELDYRAKGGFVPIGAKEKADDVPARLSVNEFVFTADAVRSAGGGDIDKGAEIMERVMKNLEQGGQISEDSQGLQGAREMFQTSQRLGEVL